MKGAYKFHEFTKFKKCTISRVIEGPLMQRLCGNTGRFGCGLFGRGLRLLWTDSSVTSSSDVTRRRLLIVARRIYVLFAVIHIIQSLLVWCVRDGSI